MLTERTTSDIYISVDLRKLLEVFKDSSEVAKLLLYHRLDKEILNESHVNFISISSEDPKKISYLTQDRISKISQSSTDDFWESSKRFQTSPGKFVSKLFKNIDQREIENFATLYRNFSTRNEFDFKVVSGDKIREYYNQDSYFNKNGTLGASCMRSGGCDGYFSIYTKNSNVSMLVMLSPNDKVMGRAILWTCDDGTKIMDRVYTISDEDYSNHFFKWCRDNGYLYKVYQNYRNTLQVTDGIKKFEKMLSVSCSEYEKYPYVDTFKWLIDGHLLNHMPKDYDSSKLLISPCGGYERGDIMELDYITREYLNKGEMCRLGDLWTSTNNCNYSETFSEWMLRKDAKWDSLLEDYIHADDSLNSMDLIKERIRLLKSYGKSIEFSDYGIEEVQSTQPQITQSPTIVPDILSSTITAGMNWSPTFHFSYLRSTVESPAIESPAIESPDVPEPVSVDSTL